MTNMTALILGVIGAFNMALELFALSLPENVLPHVEGSWLSASIGAALILYSVIIIAYSK